MVESSFIRSFLSPFLTWSTATCDGRSTHLFVLVTMLAHVKYEHSRRWFRHLESATLASFLTSQNPQHTRCGIVNLSCCSQFLDNHALRFFYPCSWQLILRDYYLCARLVR